MSETDTNAKTTAIPGLELVKKLDSNEKLNMIVYQQARRRVTSELTKNPIFIRMVEGEVAERANKVVDLDTLVLHTYGATLDIIAERNLQINLAYACVRDSIIAEIVAHRLFDACQAQFEGLTQPLWLKIEDDTGVNDHMVLILRTVDNDEVYVIDATNQVREPLEKWLTGESYERKEARIVKCIALHSEARFVRL